MQPLCRRRAFHFPFLKRLSLAGLGDLLSDASHLRDAVRAGRRNDRERHEHHVAEARAAAKKATEAAERALLKIAEASDEESEIYMDLVKLKRREAEAATARMDACLDALSESADDEDPDLMGSLWDALHGPLTALSDADDLRMLNATLREYFARFELRREAGGRVGVKPVLSFDGIGQLMANAVGHNVKAELMSDGSVRTPSLTDDEAERVASVLTGASTALTDMPQAPGRTRAPGQVPDPPSARLRAPGSP